MSDGTIKLTPQQEAVKLGIAQDVSKLTSEQRAMMKKLGIPLEQIDEAGYSYAPHTLTDEAKKEAKGGGFFHSQWYIYGLHGHKLLPVALDFLLCFFS